MVRTLVFLSSAALFKFSYVVAKLGFMIHT